MFLAIPCYNGKKKKRKTRLHLKCLCIDNGEAYISWEFKVYYLNHGVKHDKTVFSTLQHNGVAKWVNWMIMKKVWFILRMTNLPKSF